ncbi:sulfotransferase 1C4 [Nephila pilipes]|uniref:Sulfotransferase 1C4 n=1 Tax=Nephila pilipes TaxID=299642 RepID=A0A8X6U9I2_NEPPI|nr:sulfotransferase 1C4 [Nephila pilipes]
MSSSTHVKAKTDRKPKIPHYQDIDGFRIPGFFSVEAYKSALGYKPRPDDLFIVTYPKCGTTWVQNIVACIFRGGKPFQSALEFFTETPFLEMTGSEAAETMKRPGAIKLHLPFHLTPWSPNAKYIFVARNPKDCCVSFYHHTERMPGYQFEKGKFDDFFELFIKGEVDFGDYFDTLLSWYEHRNDPNVLFITYEQLKKDARNYVLKIAEFIGSQYKEKLEKDEKILDDVIHHSSFSFMKVHLHKHLAELGAIPKHLIVNNPDIPEGMRKIMLSGDFELSKKDSEEMTFIRKGIVGDWRNYFSPTQNARLEKKFRERTVGTDLTSLWKDDITITIIGGKEEVEAAKNELNSLIAELKDTAETTTEIDPKHHRYFVIRGTTVLKQSSNDYGNVTVSFPKFVSNSRKVVLKVAKDFLEPAKQSLYEAVEDLEEMVTVECLIPQEYHRTVLGTRGRN